MPPTSLSLSWAYCWGRNGYGREWRCSWENREERVWHVSTAMCCFPAYSHQTLLLSLPHFRTGHCSKEPKTMKQENTHPILKFWMGPFSLYFLFPHLISDHVMCYPRKLFLSNFVLSTCICMYNFRKDRRRIPLKTSRILNWENKTCKPKRPISYCFEAEGKKPKEIALSLKDE